MKNDDVPRRLDQHYCAKFAFNIYPIKVFEDQQSFVRFCVSFLVFLGFHTKARYYLQIGHNHFVPHSSQFTVHNHHSMLNELSS